MIEKPLNKKEKNQNINLFFALYSIKYKSRMFFGYLTVNISIQHIHFFFFGHLDPIYQPLRSGRI